MLEAMASGLPAVASRCLGIQAFARHDHNALLADPQVWLPSPKGVRAHATSPRSPGSPAALTSVPAGRGIHSVSLLFCLPKATMCVVTRLWVCGALMCVLKSEKRHRLELPLLHHAQ